MSAGPLFLPPGGVAAAGLLVTALALAGVLAVWTWSRPDGRRLAARLTATLLALLCLLALALRPHVRTSPRAVEAVLLTPGVAAGTVQAEARRGASVFAFELPGAAAPIVAVPDAGWLARHHPEVAKLRIRGHGLEAEAWQALPGVELLPELEPVSAGIARVHWQRQLVPGAELLVQGSVSALAAPAALSLLDPGGAAADSAGLQPGAEASFELRAAVRGEGRFEYRLELRDAAGALLTSEALGVAAVAPEGPRILWIEGAPSFESKHIKDWAARGGALTVRSRVSRDRRRTELLNLREQDLDVLDAALLEGFDLLVTDGRALEQLGEREREAVREAVEGGLGLLVRADELALAGGEPFPGSGFFLPFETLPMGQLDESRVRPVFGGLKPGTAAELPIVPLEIRPGWASSALATDAQGRLLAAVRPSGRGRVALTLLAETWRWVLEGNGRLHAAWWAHVVAETARRAASGGWSLRPGPVLLDAPVELGLETPRALPDAVVDEPSGRLVRLALAQQAGDPQRWVGSFWPREAGWHRVAAAGGGPQLWFLAQPPGQWRAWQETGRVDATLARADEGSGEHRPARVPRELPRLAFYLIFVACLAFLWLEERLG
jgi:hypothetical protein